ncbi:uncharacterized protein LOC135080634 [Ostrinia nubilalis]|uniref:uncharacterized protein LOC114356955 n=1 Tax=Ostrinia furnacalis TaxID=93504 RepID=UPI00103DDA1B|nr:uncharacterized protein LOC114356955 [Ostrinia furnacalis]
MGSCNKQKSIAINLDIGDQLTSISCGHVVVELIKFIAYQRLQIPYTYQWLKQIVTKKKMCEDEEKKDSFQSERHFRIASTALDNLDFILKSLLAEIGGPSTPEEVCIALGATPVTCKEVYRLILPSAVHKPQCHSPHIANDQKIQRNVFRTLVTSETLSQVFFSSLPPTNMYVFIKKKNVSNQDEVVNPDNFVLTSGCRIPRNSRIVTLDFRSPNTENISCCNDFHVFGDAISNNLENLQIQENVDDYEEEFNEIESTDSLKWYQSSYVMKGFKDCTVNGSSVTNSWLES